MVPPPPTRGNGQALSRQRASDDALAVRPVGGMVPEPRYAVVIDEWMSDIAAVMSASVPNRPPLSGLEPGAIEHSVRRHASRGRHSACADQRLGAAAPRRWSSLRVASRARGTAPRATRGSVGWFGTRLTSPHRASVEIRAFSAGTDGTFACQLVQERQSRHSGCYFARMSDICFRW
jgi:hypothetical protein